MKLQGVPTPHITTTILLRRVMMENPMKEAKCHDVRQGAIFTITEPPQHPCLGGTLTIAKTTQQDSLKKDVGHH
jgi:hypothetical protein